jgi:serine beta-lactamase-like protein LACTB, mitochondrial
MRNSFLISGLLILVLGFTGCRKKETERIISRKFLKPIKESRQEAIFYMVRTYMPGSSVAISVDGKLVWSEGLGLASKDLKVPASRVTKYRIGQVTETLTALAYHLLVEKGTLHPDSSVEHYLPDFPRKKYKITLRNLIGQTSGLRAPTDQEKNWKGINVSIEAGLDVFKNDSLLYEPGTYMFPSPYNFDLLGAVIQKATGKKFNEVIKETITDKLGMEGTVPENTLGVIENRTNYYDHDYLSRVVNSLSNDIRHRMPSEGYLSTAEDLNKFGNALLFSGDLSDSVKSKIFRPVQLPGGLLTRWGNGWFIVKNEDGIRYYFVTGNITGGGAALVIFPEEKLVVAWVSNIEDEIDEFPIYKVAMNFLNFIRGVSDDATDTAKKESDPTGVPAFPKGSGNSGK